jgi:O-antigen ligase
MLTGALLVLTYRAQIFSLIGKSPDMTGRTKIWKIVLNLIDQRPLQGWGWSSYWVPWVEPYRGLVVINHVPYFQAHNAFLDVWLQLGIVGLGLFLLLLAMTFVRLWRLAVRHTSPLYLWPILVFVGIVTQNLTESRMLVEIGWVMLVLFAIKVRDPDDSLEPRGRSPKLRRIKRLATIKEV